MKACDYSWDRTDLTIPNCLIKRNLNLETGDFVAIVGGIVSGKRALLRACCGGLDLVAGTVRFAQAGAALVQQSPWLQHQSLRQNILFGSEYDKEKYGQ